MNISLFCIVLSICKNELIDKYRKISAEKDLAKQRERERERERERGREGESEGDGARAV